MAKKKTSPPAASAEQLETLAGMGSDLREAALLLNLTPEQLAEQLAAHPDLQRAWDTGKATADQNVAQSLYRNACAGNVEAQKFWLQTRQPGRWIAPKTKPAAGGEAPTEDVNPFEDIRLA